MTEVATPAGRARTQAERTARTRAALLEATVACLVETGYAGTTTKQIAARAGVTRGAQAHHFESKADLVTEAVRFLAQKMVVEFVVPIQAGASERQTIVETLDRLWSLHRSDVFTAAIELWSAARTDDELRTSLRSLEQDIMEALAVTANRTLPELSKRRSVFGLMSTTLATLRGLALLTFVHDDVEREWQRARADLLTLWEAELDRAEAEAADQES